MHKILHRVNTKDALLKAPKEFGVEVDIRTRGNQLIMHHDPFQDGEDFENWLEVYQHGILILNVKEEGLEERLIEIMQSKGIKDYFFLDQSFPFLVKWAKAGERRCAVRVSEFESIESALTLAGKVDWVWVDCFTKFPLDNNSFRKISKHFKICLVSPELVGRKDEIKVIKQQISKMNIDAICTKFPHNWSTIK